jgi:hypothetical protein
MEHSVVSKNRVSLPLKNDPKVSLIASKIVIQTGYRNNGSIHKIRASARGVKNAGIEFSFFFLLWGYGYIWSSAYEDISKQYGY